MTNDYKKALEWVNVSADFLPSHMQSHYDTIRSAMLLAQEAEQLRKERDELATAIIKIHEDQEGDYDFLKFISHPQYILAKKVSDQNG